jgi:hypothetical protein
MGTKASNAQIGEIIRYATKTATYNLTVTRVRKIPLTGLTAVVAHGYVEGKKAKLTQCDLGCLSVSKLEFL